MADSREIGMRVGAATNQAVSVAVQLIAQDKLGTHPKEVATYAEQLAIELLGVMDGLQVAATGGAIAAAFGPGTVVVSTPAAQPAPSAPYQQPAPVSNGGYNTAFSGSTKPLKLSEHPELDGWLHAQCAAIGVTEVWDNRNKDAYKTAISNGAAKTPPPFRSATDGIDKSFWPPK